MGSWQVSWQSKALHCQVRPSLSAVMNRDTHWLGLCLLVRIFQTSVSFPIYFNFFFLKVFWLFGETASAWTENFCHSETDFRSPSHTKVPAVALTCEIRCASFKFLNWNELKVVICLQALSPVSQLWTCDITNFLTVCFLCELSKWFLISMEVCDVYFWLGSSNNKELQRLWWRQCKRR